MIHSTPSAAPEARLFNDPQYYTNRGLSWLKFNERVLEEARDSDNPLMERLRFLAITASNLDEFFMVRVSSLWEQAAARPGPDFSGYTPEGALRALSICAHKMMNRQYNCLTRSIVPALERAGIFLLRYNALDEAQKDFTGRYFENHLYPVLTPIAVGSGRPFPSINNRTIHLFAEMENGNERYAIVPMPTVLPRFIKIGENFNFIPLEEIISAYIGRLFPGYTVKKAGLFRVTRNLDLDIDEEEIDNLLEEMERIILRHRWGDPVRMEITRGFSDAALEFLTKTLDLDGDEIYRVSGPLDLSGFMGFVNSDQFAGLKHLYNKPLPPRPAAAFVNAKSVFDIIRERDVLVHHPYTGFDCVVRFAREAAADPEVLAIKMTFYRVSGHSPIIAALIEAAENGKQVTAVVELRARFDEENNVNWAKKLEQAGCQVVYGLAGFKTHAKMCLVVRREGDTLRRYVHMSTGNYNDITAKIYTDTGFFTCNEDFARDGSALFNMLTGYARQAEYKKLMIAPDGLRAALLSLIETETDNASKNMPAAITAKMNSVSDPEIIRALYRASSAGVQIRLLVRGICCLKTGIPGVSENISVSSIVDRFLEHSRICIFENGGQPRVFLSSADWMPRNLDRRVEAMFPVEDENLKTELTAHLETSLSDNVKRRELHPDGVYRKIKRAGKKPARSQLIFYQQA